MLPSFSDLVCRRGRSGDEVNVIATTFEAERSNLSFPTTRRTVTCLYLALYIINVYLSLDLEVVDRSF